MIHQTIQALRLYDYIESHPALSDAAKVSALRGLQADLPNRLVCGSHAAFRDEVGTLVEAALSKYSRDAQTENQTDPKNRTRRRG